MVTGTPIAHAALQAPRRRPRRDGYGAPGRAATSTGSAPFHRSARSAALEHLVGGGDRQHRRHPHEARCPLGPQVLLGGEEAREGVGVEAPCRAGSCSAAITWSPTTGSGTA